jgi:EmrB/QacA subfamily drug resistance transporter
VTRSRTLITLGIMLSLFLASMESTVVATAMPTIVGHLGGLASYSWVFSAFILASTTTVPIYGKLSDVHGRRPVFAVAMALFLLGSLLCGLAQSMSQLIAFRAIQGLGAGGLVTLAFIIVGTLYGYEQRARMQGLFSGVWGVSSVAGPLLGGFLVDQISWHWVFFINLLPGALAWALIWFLWVDDDRPAGAALRVDFLGAGLLAAGVVTLLLGLFGIGGRTGASSLSGVPLLVLAGVLFAALAAVERRAADPVLPLPMFRDRLFAAACGHGIFAGCAVFGSVAFVPLFVQAVLRTSATAAGATLMPLMLGWVLASVVGSRLLLRVGYRAVALTGMILLTLGTFQMSHISAHSSHLSLLAGLAPMGIGMGLSVPSLLIAVQTSVPRSVLGTATSTLQFSRSMGGALGVSVMGALLSFRLHAALTAAGMDPAGGTAAALVNRLLDPLARPEVAGALTGTLREALAGAIQGVFGIALVAAALGLAATAMVPRGRIAHLAARREGV